MPITVVYPQSGDPFGPGFTFRAEWSGTGDLSGDAHWQISVTAPPNELAMGVLEVDALANPIEQIWYRQGVNGAQAIPARPEWVTGESAQLGVALFDVDDELLGFVTVPVVLDRQAGQVAEIGLLLEAQSNAALLTPAFTTEDRTSLQIVQAAVTPQLGHGVADLLGDIGQLLMHPPLSVGGLSSPPFSLSGDGFIPVLVPKAIFGLYWLATEIPDGFGRQLGNSIEYQQRLVQFRTVHTVGGVELVTEVQDFHTDGQLWLWQIALPTRVEYSIAPGVVLSVRWWQFP